MTWQLRQFYILGGFLKLGCNSGVPIAGSVAYWGPYWGPLFWETTIPGPKFRMTLRYPSDYLEEVMLLQYVVVSKEIWKPQYKPQETISLNIGTPVKASLILGNPHVSQSRTQSSRTAT